MQTQDLNHDLPMAGVLVTSILHLSSRPPAMATQQLYGSSKRNCARMQWLNHSAVDETKRAQHMVS